MKTVQPIRDKQKIDAVKDVLHRTNLRDYCIFVIGINCGFRVSDLISLSIEDVINKRGKVRDRVTITEIQDPQKSRSYAINNAAAAALMEYLNTRKPYERSDPMFKSQKKKNGKPTAVQRSIVYKSINAAAQEVGITEPIGTHTMRKTWAYMAIMNGYSIQRIQNLFNHPSKLATMKYVGLTVKDLENIKINLEL